MDSFPLYHYQARVVRVIDGDTAELNIDLGFKIWYRISSRLAGINTPELNSTDPAVRILAQEAKARLIELLPTDGQFQVISRLLDKYGRPLVTIFLADGRDVNQMMIDEGLAVAYMV